MHKNIDESHKCNIERKRPDKHIYIYIYTYNDASYVKYDGNIPFPVEARRMVALGLR